MEKKIKGFSKLSKQAKMEWLAHVHLDMEDILPLDSTPPLQVSGDPYYVLNYHVDSIAEIQVGELFSIPPQSPSTLNAQLGRIGLPDFTSTGAVSLGLLASHISNPSNFGSTMAAAHGSNAVFPSIPMQNPGAVSTMTLGNVQNADFTSGSMVMQLVNGFPAPMNATVVLVDPQGNEVLSFDFLNVAPGDSATDGENLAGKTVPGTLSVHLKNLSSPGAGTPGIPSTYVPIDTTSTLALTALATGMTVRSATATTQTQTVVDSAFWMGFSAPPGVEITQLGWQNGQLGYTIVSGFPEAVQVDLAVPGSSVNGGAAWSQNLTVLPNTTIFGAFPWSGLVLDLAQDPSQPFNQIPLSYSVNLLSSNQPVTVDSSQAISFSFTLDNLELDYAFGFFGQDSIALPADSLSMELPVLSRLQGSISFSEPSLDIPIEYQTSLGIPMEVEVNVSATERNGNATSLQSTPSTWTLGVPVNVANLGLNTYDLISYTSANSTIEDVLKWPKRDIEFGGSIYLNPDTVQHGRFNYVSSTSGMKVGLGLTLPLAITASGLSFSDSVDVSQLGQALFTDSTWAASASLNIRSISQFPIDAQLNLRFFHADGTLLWLETLPLVHSGVVDANGFVVQATVADDVISLDDVALAQISQAKWLELEATLETAGGGQDPVKLETSCSLEVHAGLTVQVEKELL
ncbi:MAG TPA: hypothetical protein DCE58_02620 [Cryomorphaceae bacterium]|nr:hypothetical protein [Cryomorphaceae bacterium]